MTRRVPSGILEMHEGEYNDSFQTQFFNALPRLRRYPFDRALGIVFIFPSPVTDTFATA